MRVAAQTIAIHHARRQTTIRHARRQKNYPIRPMAHNKGVPRTPFFLPPPKKNKQGGSHRLSPCLQYIKLICGRLICSYCALYTQRTRAFLSRNRFPSPRTTLFKVYPAKSPEYVIDFSNPIPKSKDQVSSASS